MSTVAEICSALQRVEECTIFMHCRPDGDTVGSAAALGKSLMSLGKTVHFACSDPITPRYAYLLPSPLTESPQGVVIAVDTAAPDMSGRWQSYVENADIVIDHHGSNPRYGKINLVWADSAACGEIVFEIVKALGTLTSEIAEALYVAVSTDTGCFLHGNTTPQTHRVAAELMEQELDITALNRKLFVIKSKACLLARNRLLDTIALSSDGRLATLVLSLQTIEEVGANEDDLENIAGLGMNVEGVSAAATLRQTAEKEYKVSLRSDGSIHAADVCTAFGGGGHAMAAGCTLQGSEAECRAAIMAEMEQQI